jgi:hypothetical protein
VLMWIGDVTILCRVISLSLVMVKEKYGPCVVRRTKLRMTAGDGQQQFTRYACILL